MPAVWRPYASVYPAAVVIPVAVIRAAIRIEADARAEEVPVAAVKGKVPRMTAKGVTAWRHVGPGKPAASPTTEAARVTEPASMAKPTSVAHSTSAGHSTGVAHSTSVGHSTGVAHSTSVAHSTVWRRHRAPGHGSGAERHGRSDREYCLTHAIPPLDGTYASFKIKTPVRLDGCSVVEACDQNLVAKTTRQ